MCARSLPCLRLPCLRLPCQHTRSLRSSANNFVSRFFSSVVPIHSTTILAVRKDGNVVVIGDGQATMGSTILKPNAKKVRVIGGGKVICGFAGSTADCFSLLELLEKKLEQFPNQLLRSGVELAKMWRTDKYLRHLEATVVAVDGQQSITITGNGDVLGEPENGVVGIGSGGFYAVSAARALIDLPEFSARQIAIKSMEIASDLCIYTNKNFIIESFESGVLVAGATKAEREIADREERDRLETEKKKQQLKTENKHLQLLQQENKEDIKQKNMKDQLEVSQDDTENNNNSNKTVTPPKP